MIANEGNNNNNNNGNGDGDGDDDVGTILSASCDFTNSYSDFFKVETDDDGSYKVAPKDLVAYVTFKVEMANTKHTEVLINLKEMKKPDSDSKGINAADQSCFVLSGTTKEEQEEGCEWTGSDNNK